MSRQSQECTHSYTSGHLLPCKALPGAAHWEQLRVQCLAQGHFDKRTVGAAPRTADTSIIAQPALANKPQKAKVSIFQTICTLPLTRGLELWALTARTRSLTQAVDDECILRERMRSSDTQDQLGVGLLLLHIRRSQLSCFRCPLEKACPTGRRPMRRARIRWSDCVFQLARERLGMLLEELDEVPGEREVRAPLPDSCHCDLTPDRAEEADGRTG